MNCPASQKPVSGRVSAKRWDYASGLSVRIEGGKVFWENLRRGDEWGCEQTVQNFLAKGPTAGISSIDKSYLRDMLAALGQESAPWLPALGEEKTVTLDVLGVAVRFIDDESLEAHDDEGTRDIIARMGKTAEEYWRSKKLRKGYLAADTRILQFVFKANTELLLHSNGNLFIGTLRNPARVNGVEFAANNTLIFHPSGAVESGELSQITTIGELSCYGRLCLYADGKVSSANLAQPAVIGGVQCGRGPVYFAEDGAVRSHC